MSVAGLVAGTSVDGVERKHAVSRCSGLRLRGPGRRRASGASCLISPAPRTPEALLALPRGAAQCRGGPEAQLLP